MPNFKAGPMPKARWWLAVAALALVLAACGGSQTAGPTMPAGEPAASTAAPATPTGEPAASTAAPATPTGEPTPGTEPTPTPTGEPAPGTEPTPTPTDELDSDDIASATPVAPTPTRDPPEPPDEATQLMRATIGGDLSAIVDAMVATGNQAFIPVLMELMRFRFEYIPGLCLPCAIDELSGGTDGEDIPPELRHWAWWMEWLGNHPEVQPPSGFAGWKGELYSAIDPNFRQFFYDGMKTRIRLEEVAWGGVRKDGIPDLQDPPHIPADEAGYILDSDRVFGLSINGEHRAYPLRILNPHEMANDVLGGVPFALSY